MARSSSAQENTMGKSKADRQIVAAQSRLKDAEIRISRVHRCTHPEESIKEDGPRPFFYSVADGRKGSRYNPRAHGNVLFIKRCRRCGGMQEVLVNQGHTERSSWKPTHEMYSQRAYARKGLEIAKERKRAEEERKRIREKYPAPDIIRMPRA